MRISLTVLTPLALLGLLFAPDGTIVFEDVALHAGISFVLNNSVTAEKYSIETMIGGAAVFDYDNDGHLDIYFPNGARLPGFDKSDPSFANRLYRNNGNGTFSEVTEAAGVRGKAYAMGVATGDYDNDGDVDLYVAGVDHNQLFRNNGDGTFSDVTAAAGVTGVHPQLGKLWAITAAWIDYDRDGFLDLFVSNYLTWSVESNPPCRSRDLRAYCHPNMFKGTPNMLYRNNGNGTFTDVSDASGIGKHIGKGMGVALGDYDNDGCIDIFVSNDTFRNFLFHNSGDGTFSEDAILSGVAYIESGSTVAGMGADFKDIDNDGLLDLFQTAMFGNTFPLYRNLGAQFLDHTTASGLAVFTRRLTAYGLGIADFDNDGWKDLFTANGAILDNSMEIDNLPFPLPNSLYRNLGKGRFEDASQGAGKDFVKPLPHRGAALGDFDNDGRMDLVCVALNSPTQLFMNRSANRHHWIIFNLIGQKSNRDGLGARILVEAGGVKQINDANTAVGYNSASDRRVHFGLGTASRVEHVEIRWPSGKVQVLKDLAADQLVTVKEAP
jgi:enediyne biosynthesis protein E4